MVLYPVYVWVMLVISLVHATSKPGQRPFSIQHGQYNIINCNGNTDHVHSVLDAMYNIVFEGITAVKVGTKNPAYNAYFKSDINKPFIDEVLVNITTGSSHLIRNRGGANLTENPNIVCASGPGEITITTDTNILDPFVEFCVKNATSPSMYIRSTKYIMLCPSFFEYSVAPHRFQPNCPTTDNSHGWYDQSDWLDYVGFQPYFLIHEMVRFYLGSVPSFRDWNICAGFDPKVAIYNPGNYVYYLHSVVSRCTAFRRTSSSLQAKMESYIPEAFRSRLASRKAAIAFLRAINTDVSAWIIDFERSIDLLAVSEVIIGGRQDEL